MKKTTKLLGLSAAAALLISAPAMAQDVKLGFLADLTGPIAGFAPGMVDTGNIAIKNVNDQGGILAGQNLVSVVADTTCDGGAGGPAGDRMVNTENVTAIFGAYCSGPVISAATTAAGPRRLDKRSIKQARCRAVLRTSSAKSVPCSSSSGPVVSTLSPMPVTPPPARAGCRSNCIASSSNKWVADAVGR